MATTYTTPISFHPGTYLREWLEENNMTSKELSLRLSGKPEKTISNILTGKSSITPELAEALSLVTGIPGRMWNSLQAKYNSYIAAQENSETLAAQWDSWGTLFPYKAMVLRGWIDDLRSKSKGERVRQLLSFLGISHSAAFERIYGELLPQFRMTKGANHDPYSTAVWLRQGQLLAQQLTLKGKFDTNKVPDFLPRLKEVLISEDQSQGKLEELTSEMGVAFVILPHLPNASISGVAMWIGETPTIILSGKGKRHDTFVFNFFHELGHILMHKGRSQKARIFIDDETQESVEAQEEVEANDFASEILLSSEQVAQCPLTIDGIQDLAHEQHVHPCVVLGRLVREKRITWKLYYSRYKALTAQTILPA